MKTYEFFKSLLQDEYGISEESFNLMRKQVDMMKNQACANSGYSVYMREVEKIEIMLAAVDAQGEPRYFLPENFKD